jgi:hypothetical protein
LKKFNSFALVQITFFAGLMVISAQMQMDGRNSCCPCIGAKDEYEEDGSVTSKRALKHHKQRSANTVIIGQTAIEKALALEHEETIRQDGRK